MKEALTKISGVQLLYKEELTCVKVLHRKGQRYCLGLKTYKDDLLEYKGITRFNSLQELAQFMDKAISIDSNNKIWLVPQVRIYTNNSFCSGSIKTTSYKTNEDAERAFNELVEQNHLTINN